MVYLKREWDALKTVPLLFGDSSGLAPPGFTLGSAFQVSVSSIPGRTALTSAQNREEWFISFLWASSWTAT